MIEAGLLVHGEDIAVPYDRFRDRVMFPIHDRAGRVIAFGGRAMEAGAKAKYLNSPETALFHKGALLFNHHRARKAAHDAGAIVVVEGYIDVISVSEGGFPNVVAPLGTALTPDQCALLWAMASEPILCFDGDSAGRRAAFRAIETALPLIGAGKSLRFALLPEGQDPDDLIRQSGPAAIAEHLKDPRPLADMLFMRETDGERFDTPEQRAALERRLGETVGKIADETLRRHYQADVKRRLSAFFGDERDRPARGYASCETSLRPSARRAFSRARPTRRRRRNALGPAEQARPKFSPAGARGHDPFDCAWPSSADREPVRRAGGDRIHRRWSQRIAGRAARRPSRRADLVRDACRMADRRRSWASLRADFGLGRKDAELVVHAAGGVACGRRSGAEAKLGLASAGWRVK